MCRIWHKEINPIFFNINIVFNPIFLYLFIQKYRHKRLFAQGVYAHPVQIMDEFLVDNYANPLVIFM